MAESINDFKKGDTVFHKSRPQRHMAVLDINEDNGTIECSWIGDTTIDRQTQDFEPHELVIVDPSKGSPFFVG